MRIHCSTPMKISVFARGSNPAIDRHIQRKSVSYCEEEVQALRADWVDPDDHCKGIICREFLYFGEKLTPAQPEQVRKLSLRSALPPLEVSGTLFNDPEISTVKFQNRLCLVVRARAFAHMCDIESAARA
jgi:hypothetical protein